jgi:hypothetical protein
MKEKILELLLVLGYPDDTAKAEIIHEWIRRNCVYVSDPFKLNPNLFGKEKEMAFVRQIKTSALKMGEMALLECGQHHLKEEKETGEYHLVEFLLFKTQRPEDREWFLNGGGPSKPKLILS